MSLSSSERALARLTAAIVLGRRDELVALRRSAAPGEPDRRWRESVLQAHLFAGFPRVVEACHVLQGAGGLGPPETGEVGDERSPSAGSALFELIYADRAGEVRAELAGYHPELARWIETHAYGRVLARPGLAADRRELLAVAALAAQGQERQLAAHARGAVRLGASAEEVCEVVEALADLLEGPLLERAREVVGHFARS